MKPLLVMARAIGRNTPNSPPQPVKAEIVSSTVANSSTRTATRSTRISPKRGRMRAFTCEPTMYPAAQVPNSMP